MSPVAAGLDGLLALLLVAALVLGAQLNARLKALRDSQAGFAAAVLELNQAAGRAEAGLNALKTAQADAHDELLSRIEVARGLAAKLERAGADAERRAAHAAAPSAEPGPRGPAAAPSAALAAIAALAEGRAPGRPADATTPDGRTGAEGPRPDPSPRRKPARDAFDEELFEAKPRRESPEPAAAAPAAPSAAPAQAGDLGPRAADKPARPDPLRKWKAVR